MKEMELYAVNELIQIYERLLKTGLSEELSNMAKLIYDELIPGNTLLRADLNSVVIKLFSVAYPNVDPDLKTLTKEEIIEILVYLKKIKNELER